MAQTTITQSDREIAYNILVALSETDIKDDLDCYATPIQKALGLSQDQMTRCFGIENFARLLKPIKERVRYFRGQPINMEVVKAPERNTDEKEAYKFADGDILATPAFLPTQTAAAFSVDVPVPKEVNYTVEDLFGPVTPRENGVKTQVHILEKVEKPQVDSVMEILETLPKGTTQTSTGKVSGNTSDNSTSEESEAEEPENPVFKAFHKLCKKAEIPSSSFVLKVVNDDLLVKGGIELDNNRKQLKALGGRLSANKKEFRFTSKDVLKLYAQAKSEKKAAKVRA